MRVVQFFPRFGGERRDEEEKGYVYRRSIESMPYNGGFN